MRKSCNSRRISSDIFFIQVVVFVRTVVTTHKESTAINVKIDSTAHMEGHGMKRMFAIVSKAEALASMRTLLNCSIETFSTACNCDYFYSTGNCGEGDGHCECKPEFQAPNCDSCSEGYFGYPNCRPCECNLNGTLGYHCEATEGKVNQFRIYDNDIDYLIIFGFQCPCKANFGGDFCKECAPGYFNYPECKRKKLCVDHSMCSF